MVPINVPFLLLPLPSSIREFIILREADLVLSGLECTDTWCNGSCAVCHIISPTVARLMTTLSPVLPLKTAGLVGRCQLQ